MATMATPPRTTLKKTRHSCAYVFQEASARPRMAAAAARSSRPSRPLFTLDQLWVQSGQPNPQRRFIASTEGGACRVAGLLARYLLATEEAEELEHQLAARRDTAWRKQHGHLSLMQEMSFVAAQLATPVLLCIVGDGDIVRTCAIVDYRGRIERCKDEAVGIYLSGTPVVSVDAEGSRKVTLFIRGNAFEKLRLHHKKPILNLLKRSRSVLETDTR